MPTNISLSFDDGHELDFKVAEVLRHYGLTATFYWSMYNQKYQVMSQEKMLQFVAKYPEMEIAQHSLTHQILTRITMEQCIEEIEKGKQWHFNMFGKDPEMFAYIRGYYTPLIAKMVREFGYIGARTIKSEKKLPDELKTFEMDGSLHLYHGEVLDRGGVKTWPNVRSYFLHSWEVEKYNDWRMLEVFLSTLKPTEVKTNGEICRNSILNNGIVDL